MGLESVLLPNECNPRRKLSPGYAFPPAGRRTSRTEMYLESACSKVVTTIFDNEV